MKRGPQSNGEKQLSIKNLLKAVDKAIVFSEPMREEKRGPKSKISTNDCFKSALAMFGLKSKSLLNFDGLRLLGKAGEHNLRTLYGVKNIPSDTYMRERLDPVDPKALRPGYKVVFELLQRWIDIFCNFFLFM